MPVGGVWEHGGMYDSFDEVVGVHVFSPLFLEFPLGRKRPCCCICGVKGVGGGVNQKVGRRF